MKTTLFSLALAAASFAAAAQSQPGAAPAASAPADAYTAMLAATIAEQDAVAPAALPANVAKLERASSARPTDWLPRYYQARAYLKMGFAGQATEAKDQAFDKARAALTQAGKLPGANQAEIDILQAYIYQGRVMVDPMTRGQEYGGLAGGELAAAAKLDPQNPRLFLLLGNNLYFRPEEFGGGPAKAKPYYEKAVALFATYVPAGPLAPSWGQRMAEARLSEVTQALATTK